jgi:transcriptional regulator with XRE-family HTH domain
VKTFAQFIRARRLRKSQTQAQAAVEVGVTRQTWIAWERGQIPVPARLVMLATWARVSLEKLRPYLREREEWPTARDRNEARRGPATGRKGS